MTTMKHISTIKEIDFKESFEIESSWTINVKGLSIQNTKQMHKLEYFKNIEDLKKNVTKKFNYYVKQGLKKGTNGTVFVETL